LHNYAQFIVITKVITCNI